ncbi:unnamed protein product [Notodromas monacha]|uniref:Ribosome-recycling factor, mitochondrial n=1 Tax=Notodromas monacha TaxID=399045 RepID=A0A7R9C202_9CRUS|nr:unnamed protein product [Notodromas monacha]CAG0925464.1 unnamed protein product [Notodromas monacha]
MSSRNLFLIACQSVKRSLWRTTIRRSIERNFSAGFVKNENFPTLVHQNYTRLTFSTSGVDWKAKDRGKEKKHKHHLAIDEEEIGQVIEVEKYKEKLEKALMGLKKLYAEQVSLRTATGSLNSLKVKLEGDTFPLMEIAQIAYKTPQLIVINCAAFPQATKDVMQALEASGMNLNPQQDGTTIYVPVPKVTKEHRDQLAKNAKLFFNKCKENIRDLRNKYVADVKKMDKSFSVDVLFSVEQQVHAMSENYVHAAEEIMKAKQAELLNVK